MTGLKFDQQSPQSIAKTVKKFMNTEDVDWQANTSAYSGKIPDTGDELCLG